MPEITPSSHRAALYVRVSTADKGQSIENQLRPLEDAARRLGWSVVLGTICFVNSRSFCLPGVLGCLSPQSAHCGPTR